jgi:hypothetical protein
MPSPIQGRAARHRLAPLLCCLFLATAMAHAADDPIATDRPDFVESSNVVGRGRVQIETSMLFERDRSGGALTRTVSTPTLLRIGAGDSVEFRLETDGRSLARSTDSSGQRSTTGAWNDTAVGVKWHVDDGGGALPSLALILHADLASGSAAVRGQGVRPSLRMVAEWELPHDFSLGVMPGIGRERDEQGAAFRYGVLGVVLGRELNERLRALVEIALPRIAATRHGGSQASLNGGFAWLLSNTMQVDTVLSRGLNHRTPGLSLTVGLSLKR